MNESEKKLNITSDISNGLTAAALIGTYCICVSLSLGATLLTSLLGIVCCAVLSLKLKNGVFAPDAFFITPLIFVVREAGFGYVPLTLLIAALLFFALSKAGEKARFPDSANTAFFLGLALAGTVLLTNDYFGIGAAGATPFEMLKTFRSLGFHPNFRGLLYGTISLFSLITYPIKFRKLSKYIPPVFFALAIPFILNFFLNPHRDITAINEAGRLASYSVKTFAPTVLPVIGIFKSFNINALLVSVQSALIIALILNGRANSDSENASSLALSNSLGLFSCMPSRKHDIRGYSVISMFTVCVISFVIIIICPDLLARIPLHSVGALLIVSLWQQLPYKALAETFRSKKPFGIISVFAVPLLFVFAAPTTVFAACVLFALAGRYEK